ncbi:MAG: peptidylprolyl isomerase [Chthonomonadales bacterium]|nr:peptidylprolyl isomerase [Chthonomonadales bacterium]
MTVANRGDVTMELYPKAAPKTTARVVELARQGFYNGIRFHRVVDGFVVQAGDPKSKTDGVDVPYIGRSGSGKTIPFEKNNLPHVPGAVAMALNAPASDTADSQFFIDLADNATLNGDYCVFGKVTQGMDVVRSIKKGDAITSMTVQ